jgi:hypothetical protein
MCSSPWGRDHRGGSGRLGLRRFGSSAWGDDSAATLLIQTDCRRAEHIQMIYAANAVGYRTRKLSNFDTRMGWAGTEHYLRPIRTKLKKGN